jgi:ATP-dependent protease ClpP protease subunit
MIKKHLKRFCEECECEDELFDEEGFDHRELKSIPSIFETFDYNFRQVHVNREITDNVIEYVIASIIHYNYEDAMAELKAKEETDKLERIPIIIKINTNGGDLIPTLNLLDIMDASETPIITVGYKCFSAGLLILSAGHERFVYKNSVGLLHAGSNGFSGDILKMKDYMNFSDKLTDKVKREITERTEMNSFEYEQNKHLEKYLMAEELVGYGFADEIIEEII